MLRPFVENFQNKWIQHFQKKRSQHVAEFYVDYIKNNLVHKRRERKKIFTCIQIAENREEKHLCALVVLCTCVCVTRLCEIKKSVCPGSIFPGMEESRCCHYYIVEQKASEKIFLYSWLQWYLSKSIGKTKWDTTHKVFQTQ